MPKAYLSFCFSDLWTGSLLGHPIDTSNSAGLKLTPSYSFLNNHPGGGRLYDLGGLVVAVSGHGHHSAVCIPTQGTVSTHTWLIPVEGREDGLVSVFHN